jgi:enediyne biosynthesis protein E4
MKDLGKLTRCCICAISIALISGCKPAQDQRSSPKGNQPAPLQSVVETDPRIVLTDYTKASRLDFRHYYDGHGEKYIIEALGGGIASLDYDGDGLLDIYFLNGASIQGASIQGASIQGASIQGASTNDRSGESFPNALYRNLGGFQFVSVTELSGTDDRNFSTGVAVADYNNDGFPDIFVNNLGPDRLYSNNGDGTFSDVTEHSNVSRPELGAGACFVDVDGDSLLDLYVANYVKSPIEKNVKRTTDGNARYPGPLDFEPERDFLFHNQGDGTFVDISDQSGIANLATTSMGMIATDIDGDGDSDIVVVNDLDRNLLWENDGKGNFVEVGIQRGVAFSFDGRRNGNMGVDAGDYDNNGSMDLYTTTFSNEFPVLYRNDGSGSFTDVTLATGAGGKMKPHANWGTSFLDLENDGDKDLFVANGHVDPNVHLWAFNTSWKVANTLLLNVDGKFKDISDSAGSGLLPIESSRGNIADDLDNDGDIDIVVLNSRTTPTVMKNDTATSNHWLEIQLHGRTACRDATGSKVQVFLGGKTLTDEVHSGRGYQSSYGQRLAFGLGKVKVVPKITIRWSDGKEESWTDVQANQLLNVVQK